MSDWTLHLGDCLDPVTGLASLADKSIDHVIADPPYSVDVYMRAGRLKPGKKNSSSEIASIERMAAGEIGHMTADTVSDVISQCKRATLRWIVLFHDAESWHWYIDALGDWYVRAGVWAKPDAMPQFSGDRPGQGFEAITIGHNTGRKRWNGGGHSALWTCGTERDRDHSHPCPKPLALMQALVRDFTDPGDLICDPFAGSGTTGVAALSMGRRFVGWEKDPKYHAIACRRLERTREQLGLPLEAA
jgi:site-specific DNA-methyltransferase (adenine-specific)